MFALGEKKNIQENDEVRGDQAALAYGLSEPLKYMHLIGIDEWVEGKF